MGQHLSESWVYGVLIAAIAAVAGVTGRDRPMAIGGVFVSLGTFVVAGYNGLGEWNAYVWTPLQNLEVTKGTIQPALWALIGVSMISAVASSLLWGAGAEEVHEEMLAEEEEISEEESYSDIGGARWA